MMSQLVGRHDFDASLTRRGSASYGARSNRNALESDFAAIAKTLTDPATGEVAHGLLDDRRCPACNSAESGQPVINKYNVPIVECRDCGFWYAGQLLSAAANQQTARLGEVSGDSHIDFLISPTYLGYATKRYAYELQIVDRVAKGRPGRRLLDVGCSVGTFLDVSKSFGWDGMGVEMLEPAADQAKRKGYNVICAEYTAERLREFGPFDLVAALDTLEHVPEPRWFVAELRQVLTPRGLLLVQTPNSMSLACQLRRERDNNFNGLIHLNYFGPASLTAMVEGQGFRSLHVETILSEFEPIKQHGAEQIEKALEQLGVTGRPATLTPDFILDNNLGYKIVALFECT